MQQVSTLYDVMTSPNSYGSFLRTSKPVDEAALRPIFEECWKRAVEEAEKPLDPFVMVELTDPKFRTTNDGKSCFAYGWVAKATDGA